MQGADHKWDYEKDKDNELAVHEFLAEEGEMYQFLLTGERFSTVASYKVKISEYEIPKK